MQFCTGVDSGYPGARHADRASAGALTNLIASGLVLQVMALSDIHGVNPIQIDWKTLQSWKFVVYSQ